ncbi:TAXI family TRAP transporter solute-binding subunit [Fusibacter paucivorans]|uniref:TAXI family TRAP transporter solute-binding subunit n=1 Tax=Fusibacter paucivorans TaxID=76009 RepID=A0ABS5PU20_9FIRM|nr:TAXI family TRAP transporter solute-binding subunit [Fusibacter paucivorans]MBS7527522.1 TAXI family TRAP transporter solute-binding subunit [Fusibacter paucivorans]
MKKQNITALMLVTVLILALVGCGSQPETTGASDKNSEGTAEKSQFYAVGTAGTGGAYYPIGIAIADVLTNSLEIQSTAKVTGGAPENNVLVNENTVQIAITQGPMAYAAVNGEAPYTEKMDNIATLFTGLSKGVLHIVVMNDSNIQTFADLKGKTIAMGPAGGGAINVASDIFKVYGFGLEDINATYLAYSEGVDALKDGNVDAAVIQSAAPASAVTQLAATTTDFKILSIEDDKMAEILSAYPYYSEIEIDKSMYDISESAKTIYLSNMVVVSKSLSDDEVYEITKAIFESVDKIKQSHPSAAGLTLEDAVTRVPIPLHAGAERYFKERGVLN